MLTDELVEIIKQIRHLGVETQDIECKAAKSGLPRSLLETLSAFSNSPGGGIALLGIGDGPDFEMVSVQDPARIQDQLGQMCAQELEPPIRPHISTHLIHEFAVIVVEVPEVSMTEKPVFVKSGGLYYGSYIRTADGDHRLTQYEVLKLIENRGQPRYDVQPIQEGTLDDLDDDLVEPFLVRVRERSMGVLQSKEPTELMKLTRIVTEEDGRLVPTLAGLLMFGLSPQFFFPSLRVAFVVYPNVDPKKPGPHGERYLANESVEGPIPIILKHLMLLLNRHLSKRSVITGAPEREEPWEYPQEALREVLANALLHRDYSAQARGSQVQVALYPDRLTVSNPGGLFGTVTLDTIDQPDVQQARNAALMRMAEDLGLVENRGGGVGTMIAALRRHNLSLPDFENSLIRFRVTFRNHMLFSEEALRWLDSIGANRLANNQRLGLVYVREEGTITNSDYRRLCGVTIAEATKDLSDLVELRYLIMLGTRRWASYRLTPKYSEKDADLRFADLPHRSKDVWDFIRKRAPIARRHIVQHFKGDLTRSQVDYRLHRLLESGLVQVTNPVERASNREYVVLE